MKANEEFDETPIKDYIIDGVMIDDRILQWVKETCQTPTCVEYMREKVAAKLIDMGANNKGDEETAFFISTVNKFYKLLKYLQRVEEHNDALPKS